MNIVTATEATKPNNPHNLFGALGNLIVRGNEVVLPAAKPEFDHEVISGLIGLLQTVFEAAEAQIDSRHVQSFELMVAYKLGQSIEALSKQVSAHSNGGWSTVKWEWHALRAQAEVVRRRLEVLAPSSEEEFKAAIKWFAEKGVEQDLRLLRRISSSSPYGSTEVKVLLDRADRSICHRIFDPESDLHPSQRTYSKERQENIQSLAAMIENHRAHPFQALGAATALGLMGDELLQGKEVSREMEMIGARSVSALLTAMCDAEHPTLRAEVTWALGKLGDREVTEQLMNRILQIWRSEAEVDEVRIALLGALEQTLDRETLERMNRYGHDQLNQVHGTLFEHLRDSVELERDLLFALIQMLVCIELRSEAADIGIDAGSVLEYVFRQQVGNAAVTIAAVVALNELTAPEDRNRLWEWASSEDKPASSLGAWPTRLNGAAGRELERSEYHWFLSAAAQLEAIAADSQRALHRLQHAELPI